MVFVIHQLGMIDCPIFLFKAEISLWRKRKEEIMIQYTLILSKTVFLLSRRIYRHFFIMVNTKRTRVLPCLIIPGNGGQQLLIFFI